MAIDGNNFYETKRDQFAAGGINVRFGRDYITALNNSLLELSIGIDSASRPQVASVQQSIDWPADRRPALEACVDYWLTLYGHESGDLDLKSAWSAKEAYADLARMDRDLDTNRTEDASTDTDAPNAIGNLN